MRNQAETLGLCWHIWSSWVPVTHLFPFMAKRGLNAPPDFRPDPLFPPIALWYVDERAQPLTDMLKFG